MAWRESELEDYIAANPYEFFASYYINPIDNIEIGLIGRQLKCRYGVIDLLFYTTTKVAPIPVFTIVVVELKAVPAGQKTLEQVLRYRAALEEIGIYDALSPDEFYEYGATVDQFIAFDGIIVAPSFHESTIWFPGRILARQTETGFSLEVDRRIKGDRHSNDQLQAAMLPILGRVAQSAKMWHTSKKLQRGTDSLNTEPPLN